jgi:hypothetical protein
MEQLGHGDAIQRAETRAFNGLDSASAQQQPPFVNRRIH